MPRDEAEFTTITMHEPRVWTTRARWTIMLRYIAPILAFILALPVLTLVTEVTLILTLIPVVPQYEGLIRAAIAPSYAMLIVSAFAARSKFAYPMVKQHRRLRRHIQRIAPEASQHPLAFPGELTLSPRITTGLIAKLDDGDDIGVFVVSTEGLTFHGDRVTLHAPLAAILSVESRSDGWKHFWAGRQLELTLRTPDGEQRVRARVCGNWSAASGNAAFRAFFGAVQSHRGMARVVHG